MLFYLYACYCSFIFCCWLALFFFWKVWKKGCRRRRVWQVRPINPPNPKIGTILDHLRLFRCVYIFYFFLIFFKKKYKKKKPKKKKTDVAVVCRAFRCLPSHLLRRIRRRSQKAVKTDSEDRRSRLPVVLGSFALFILLFLLLLKK